MTWCSRKRNKGFSEIIFGCCLILEAKLKIRREQQMRNLGRNKRQLAVGLAIAFILFLPSIAVRADRCAGQSAPGRDFEKAGKNAEAALYYQRAMLAFQNVWRKFWPHINAQIVKEYRDRFTGCLKKANLGKTQFEKMDYINKLWMDEYIDQELGGFKLAFPYRAEEAEKHGDFLLAEKLRKAAADFYRIVAIPYHEQTASMLKKQRKEAALHRNTIKEYESRVTEHERMALGDKILAGIGGLQAPQSRPDPASLNQHYFKIYRLYDKRVLPFEKSRWITGRTPQQVAAILEEKGLKHDNENARFASVVVLANLGEKEAVVTALKDRSLQVRIRAAQALAEFRWAEGWHACLETKDHKEIHPIIEALIEPLRGEVLSRSSVIAGLLKGLESEKTAEFCHNALEHITSKKGLSASQWRQWWMKLGNAKPGLIREDPIGSAVVDEAIDFGAWWQSGMYSIQNRSNLFANYSFPAKILWRGRLAITRSGRYQFFLRNRGKKGKANDPSEGLFTTPCAKLLIDGQAVLSNPRGVVEDTYPYMRIDYSDAIELEAGLHEILLEFEVESADPKFGMGPHNKDRTPCVRLYWSSEHFLRQLVPAEHLIHMDNAKR